MKKIKIIISVIITILIFIIILLNINIKQLVNYLVNINILYFIIAFLFFFIPIFLSGYKFKLILCQEYNLRLWESVKLIFLASSFNIFLPAKLGDISKAFFLKKDLNLKIGIGATLFEKFLDLFSLALITIISILIINKWDDINTIIFLICLIILIIFFLICLIDLKNVNIRFLKEINIFLIKIKNNKKLFFNIIILSLITWILHLIQIYFIFLSLNLFIKIELIFSLVPIAIFIGLIPITIAGMGTRDSALIVLFKGYAPASHILGIGLFFSLLRYWIPGLIGLIWIKKYISKSFKK